MEGIEDVAQHDAEAVPALPLNLPLAVPILEGVVGELDIGPIAPPPSPVEAMSPQPDLVLPQLEAVAVVLGNCEAGSRRSTRSQPGELVAGLEGARRSKRKLSVSLHNNKFTDKS